MTINEYQRLAMRTCNLEGIAKERHALHGMVGEIGEIHSIYQKAYQGHEFNYDELKKEMGDLLWFVAELADYQGWELEEIMRLNIEKLKKRYPNGFEANRSVHREE